MPNEAGAEGNEGGIQPNPQQGIQPDTYTVIKEPDGTLKVNEVRYVPESDLLANKDANQKRIDDLTEQHKVEISKLSGDGDSSRQLLLQIKAENESLKARVADYDKLRPELDKARTDALALKSLSDTNADLALNYRKQVIQSKYNISGDKLEGKDMSQLTSFEEALQAVGALQGNNSGNGNYAAGGGQGGSPKPQTPMDRAKASVDSAMAAYKPGQILQ